MMPEYLEDAIAALVRDAGAGSIHQRTRLASGGNNRVFRLETDAGAVLLKHYHHDPEDGRDRAAAEFELSLFAWSGGIRCIPQPLAVDHTFHFAVFEFVEGSTPVAGTVGAAEIGQALAFFTELNRLRARPESSGLRFAAESCFTAEDHLGLVGSRVRRAARIEACDATSAAARDFVEQSLVPRWQDVERRAAHALDALPDAGAILRQAGRCVSPSDFGFHNAIRRGGDLVFHDFEYGGWDDPAKTVCDFFCQPKVPVGLEHWPDVVSALDAAVGFDSQLDRRARILLDVYRIKWCCIALNEFHPRDAQRRDFAADSDVTAQRRHAAIATAEAMLARIGEASEF